MSSDKSLEELRELADRGVTVIVGSRGAHLIPEMVRGWGIRPLPDARQVEIYIAESTGRQTLENLVENGQIAITVTVPSTYRSIQFKGRAIETSAPFPEDYDRLERDREAFIAAVGMVGLSRPLATRVFAAELELSTAMIKILASVEEVFEQTPGPRAGSRL